MMSETPEMSGFWMSETPEFWVGDLVYVVSDFKAPPWASDQKAVLVVVEHDKADHRRVRVTDAKDQSVEGFWTHVFYLEPAYGQWYRDGSGRVSFFEYAPPGTDYSAPVIAPGFMVGDVVRHRHTDDLGSVKDVRLHAMVGYVYTVVTVIGNKNKLWGGLDVQPPAMGSEVSGEIERILKKSLRLVS